MDLVTDIINTVPVLLAALVAAATALDALTKLTPTPKDDLIADRFRLFVENLADLVGNFSLFRGRK